MFSRTRCWRALWIIMIWFWFFLMFVPRGWRWQMVKLLIALQVLPEHWCIVEGSWPHNLPHYVHIFIQLYIKVDVTTAFHLIHNWRGDVTYELQAKNGPPIFFAHLHPIGFIKNSLQGYFSVSTGTGMIVIFMVKLFNWGLFTDSFFLSLEVPRMYLFRYITDEICCYEQVIM